MEVCIGDIFILPDKSQLPKFLYDKELPTGQAVLTALPDCNSQLVEMETHIAGPGEEIEVIRFSVTLEILSKLKKLTSFN